MKVDLRVTFAAFIAVFILGVFFQEQSWFKYAMILPLGYIIYSLVVGMISAFRKR